uniref:Membrane protein insertase YidC n=1 Tax=Candidatus Aschnera chinzeii TaxID=1485666 RepID=A0AAT9G5D0_9ENTR|nr:MAG: membrane protein insertase YidC [Candidatus Aschnera chinzeii]
MDVQRNFLFIMFLFIALLIWQIWENHRFESTGDSINRNVANILNDNRQTTSSYIHDNLISVQTDVLKISIDLNGGDIYEAYLLNYNDQLHSSIPFKLLQTTKQFIYQAQSGIIGKDGPDNINYNYGARPLYYVTTKYFKIEKDKNILYVPLTFTDKHGVIYQKIFIFQRGKYNISVKYNIINNQDKALNLIFFGQLKQTVDEPENRESNNSFALHSYRGTAYSSDIANYTKYSFEDINKEDLNLTTKNGWIAMLQRYFVTAWIPNNQNKNLFYTTYLDNNIAIIGYKSMPIVVPQKSEFNYYTQLWIGPELQSEMAAVAAHLDLTVDHGWLWFISQPLFNLLKLIYGIVDNWGVAIIIITFIVRVVMYPLTKAQYTSMAKMRLLQPKIAIIRERLGDNSQKISQEMMELYKTEKVNPLGGCLPLLIQMPIFLALYYMLIGSVELRHANFIWWIQDLSAKDPYYILPMFMGITMFIIQKISPTSISDPVQQKIMMCMPFIFTIFFLWFPSGLVLYYIISNLITIIQQQIIYHGLEKVGLYTKHK